MKRLLISLLVAGAGYVGVNKLQQEGKSSAVQSAQPAPTPKAASLQELRERDGYKNPLERGAYDQRRVVR